MGGGRRVRLDDQRPLLLLPDLDRERIKALDHDGQVLRAMRLGVLPEIEWGLAASEPVAGRNVRQLHFAADVLDVLLNPRRWNEEADDPWQVET